MSKKTRLREHENSAVNIMDPLSVAASSIAIITLCVQITRCYTLPSRISQIVLVSSYLFYHPGSMWRCMGGAMPDDGGRTTTRSRLLKPNSCSFKQPGANLLDVPPEIPERLVGCLVGSLYHV